MATSHSPLIELRGVTKAYPGVIAIEALDLTILPGQVHAVVGLNGAGKSTLVKILAGSVSPESGTIVNPRSGPSAAHLVNLVPQDVVVVPEFSIGRNVLHGRERGFPLRRRLDRREEALARAALERVGLELDPETLPEECSTQELRLAQIAKALVEPGDVLLLDEPTAVLPEEDAHRLLDTLASLRDDGEAIVYVSHRLGEVVRIADQITVLRDGRKVSGFQRGQVDRKQLLELLAEHGATPGAATNLATNVGDVVLEVVALEAHECRPIDLEAHAGEAIALVGVQDAGQSSIVQAIAGLRPALSGSVRVRGEDVDTSSPAKATEAGIMLVPADRRAKGVVGAMNIVENIALSPRSASHVRGLRRRTEERHVAAGYVDRFSVKTPGLTTSLSVLSGGNQQKVVLGRAIEASPEVLLLDEPTQGIDVATKWDILARIKIEAQHMGCPVLAASSELEEIPGWADRALVFRQGKVVAQLERHQITEELLIQLAVS